MYDYIVAGLGCAGMSLLVHMIDSGRFTGKKILAVDIGEKNRNDRTWCFWEEEPGRFESVVYRSWDRLLLQGGDTERDITVMDIRPSRYKLIRGIDFYSYCLDRIKRSGLVEIRYGRIGEVNAGQITLDGAPIRAGWVFSSIAPFQPPQPGRFRLLQHFVGREIETGEPVFDPGVATLMDFRVPQDRGTCFVYIMPFSPSHALVEYTVFSSSLLQPAEYAAALDEYIARYLTRGKISVKATESGIIPMTNERGPADKKGLTFIGTAGGRTKPSTGYTFAFIQQHSAQIVRDILRTGTPQAANSSLRFRYYDSVLLNVLATGRQTGAALFFRLFRRNRPSDVLAFLDNRSRLNQDWRIVNSLPFLPFARAGWEELWRRG